MIPCISIQFEIEGVIDVMFIFGINGNVILNLLSITFSLASKQRDQLLNIFYYIHRMETTQNPRVALSLNYINRVIRALQQVKGNLGYANCDNYNLGLSDVIDINVSQIEMVIKGLRIITDNPEPFLINR